MLDPFQLPFFQRGVLEVLALSVAGGVLGTWIVLRGMAFYAHAVGTAAFPGLVLADGLGFAAGLGAFGTAVLFAGGVTVLRGRRGAEETGPLTAIVLVGCLAAGVILASDVFHSGANVETLLFGSLLAIGSGDVWLALLASAAALVASALLGRRWLAAGFDPAAARALGVRTGAGDVVLFGLVALATTAALSAVGALLVAALFVVPAATARLLVTRVRSCQVLAVALVAVEGVSGLWLSFQTNAPPGATIAVVAGVGFVLALGLRPLLARRRRPPLRAAVITAAALAALLIAGCGSGAGTSGSGPLVVATTTQLGDVARQIGGPDVRIHQILQPNTDPHEYEPRPKDVAAVADAKLVLTSGDRLDGWASDLVSQSGGDPRVLDVGATVPDRLPGETSGPEASRYDPHWWHDPRNVETAVRTIERALVAAAPQARAAIERRAASYEQRVRGLDAGIRACIATIPAAQRKLVTDHDAFGYFAHRYGLTVVGAVIPSQTTQAQPSAGDVARLTRLIRREHVRAIFPESSLSPKLAGAIGRATGARTNLELYGDTLGPSGSPGATYVGMEAANARAIATGLSGRANSCSELPLR